MSLLAVTGLVAAAKIEESPLPVPSVIFPIIALSFFILLAAVTWSYRDVANRHATRAGSTPHPPTH